MFASVLSAAICGMDVNSVLVEADVSNGLPSFTMVGFPSTQVKEASDRVKTAFKNYDLQMPPKKITVNLAPADLRKEGSGFDLPIATALLGAFGIINIANLSKVMVVGEVSLHGEIYSVKGILPIVIHSRKEKCEYCIVPYENLNEGKLVKDVKVIGVKNLRDLIDFFNDPIKYEKNQVIPDYSYTKASDNLDFIDICGQENGKRAAEICASGFHNLLLIGPPGGGKTMISKRLPTIMPPLTFEESLELTNIYSIAGLLKPNSPLISYRPFRSPHHSASPQSLAGGGKNPRPGEITLSHRGVLFLDEMPEFSRHSLEILRQPLEDKVICLSRVSGTYTFPAHFILVAAMNPCPCGHYPDMSKCHCTHNQIANYQGRISKPLLDRIDICVELPSLSYNEMNNGKKGESSDKIKERVINSQKIQQSRYEKESFSFNGELSGTMIDKYCVCTEHATALIKKAFDKMSFSARSYHKILKVARTIADMDNSEKIETCHISEAISYRPFEKKCWS